MEKALVLGKTDLSADENAALHNPSAEWSGCLNPLDLVGWPVLQAIPQISLVFWGPL